MVDVIEIYANTGEVIEREFTDAELQQRAKDEKATKAAEAKAHEQAAYRAKTQTAAIAHAKSLGFTDDMISVMYPTLVEE